MKGGILMCWQPPATTDPFHFKNGLQKTLEDLGGWNQVDLTIAMGISHAGSDVVKLPYVPPVPPREV